jgi:hypothetical protein
MSFFNQTQGQPVALGINTQQPGNTVSLDLSHLAAGTQATLEVRLVNNDADTGSISTSVRLDDIEVVSGNMNTPAAATLTEAFKPAVDFTALSDVSSSMQANYGQTSFQEGGTVSFTDLGLTNGGTYGVGGPVVVVLDHLSDPTVHVLNADGTTPQGQPYFDLTGQLPGKVLAPGQATTARTLEFLDPNQVRFMCDLEVLGQLNQAPTFTSQPNTEAVAGTTYRYAATATDVDGDSLTFSLPEAPAGMTIDPASGLIRWPVDARQRECSVYVKISEVQSPPG